MGTVEFDVFDGRATVEELVAEPVARLVAGEAWWCGGAHTCMVARACAPVGPKAVRRSVERREQPGRGRVVPFPPRDRRAGPSFLSRKSENTTSNASKTAQKPLEGKTELGHEA